MTEKPFLHKKAFSNVKTNFIFHDEVVKIVLKVINLKGVLNVGGKPQSVYKFAKKYNPNVKKIKCNLRNVPLSQVMNITKLKKYLSK